MMMGVSLTSQRRPNPKGRVLTDAEMAQFKTVSSYEKTMELMETFDYTLDDLRIHPQTRELLFPLDIEEMMKPVKEGRISAWADTPETQHIGMKVTMKHLSDENLNNKPFTIVKVLPDEHKIVIDASAPGSEPHDVRYVKVPWSKAVVMQRYQSNTLLNIVSCTHASNRDKAFEEAGLDVSKIECLQVRKHPMVEQGRAWRDVPRLCDHLNHTKAKGYPFHLEFGHQIFCMANDVTVAKFFKGNPSVKVASNVKEDAKCESSFSSEPYLLIVNSSGCRIDMAPDIHDGVKKGPGVKFHMLKLYVPDERFTVNSWNNLLATMDMYMQHGLLPTAPWHEETHDDKAEDVGMIPGDLNQKWPDANAKVMIVHLFKNSGLDMACAENVKLYKDLVSMRKGEVMKGSVLLSGDMAVNVSANHCDDHLHDTIFGSTREVGTICFGCYMRITLKEAVVCSGCEKARYCSMACQLLHLKEHRRCCASFEEREKKRLQRAEAKKREEERMRRHDEHEVIARAEQEAKEAKRKALAQRTRAENIQKQADDLKERIRRAAPKPQPEGHKGKDRKAKRTTEEQLVHDQWMSTAERNTRIQWFKAHQEAERLEAQAKRLQEHLDSMKRLAKEASAHAEAAVHHVPPPPKISDFF